jgi:hypothetical protein
MKSQQVDILVTSVSHRPLAFVEIKNLPDLSEANAVAVRDGLLQEQADTVPYVMVVSQSIGYLWQLKGNERLGKSADYGRPQVLDMKPVFREYLTDAELNEHLRGAGLDLVLSHWLGNLARGLTSVLPGTAGPGPFSQFVSDIRGAHVNLEALV